MSHINAHLYINMEREIYLKMKKGQPILNNFFTDKRKSKINSIDKSMSKGRSFH